MINQKVILQFGDFAAHRLATSGIGSLWANLGDEDPGLLLDRLGGGQPRLKVESLSSQKVESLSVAEIVPGVQQLQRCTRRRRGRSQQRQGRGWRR